MRWLLGKKSGLQFLPADWRQDWDSRWESEFNDSELLYGGFLWPDLENLEETLSSFHSDLVRDFEAGWTAVGFATRVEGGKAGLGPFSPPTTARPHTKAPYGLYLLGGERLLVSVTRALADSKRELELSVHHQQHEYGLVFCDPNLEVNLPAGKREFHFLPLTAWQRVQSIGKALLGR